MQSFSILILLQSEVCFIIIISELHCKLKRLCFYDTLQKKDKLGRQKILVRGSLCRSLSVKIFESNIHININGVIIQTWSRGMLSYINRTKTTD